MPPKPIASLRHRCRFRLFRDDKAARLLRDVLPHPTTSSWPFPQQWRAAAQRPSRRRGNRGEARLGRHAAVSAGRRLVCCRVLPSAGSFRMWDQILAEAAANPKTYRTVSTPRRSHWPRRASATRKQVLAELENVAVIDESTGLDRVKHARAMVVLNAKARLSLAEGGTTRPSAHCVRQWPRRMPSPAPNRFFPTRHFLGSADESRAGGGCGNRLPRRSQRLPTNG